MLTLQRDLAFIGLIGAVAFGFCYFSEVDRRNRRETIRIRQNFVPQKRRPIITNPDHPYWRHRMIQYWDYNVN